MLNSAFLSAFNIRHSAFPRGCAMPQELLRDVLRTGDASGGARRRLSVLPVTIAVHVGAIGAFVMIPILTGVDLPSIASAAPLDYIRAVPPPPAPPPPSTPNVTPRANVAPTSAPDTIPTTEQPPAPSANNGIEGGFDTPGVQPGAGVLSDASVSAPPPALPAPPPEIPKFVRVGGVIREPRKLVHVPPIYPVIAQQARVQGAVTLEALIDVTGRVQNVKVLRTDSPLLDAAAVHAVQQWRYTPTELNGVPVQVLMTIFVRFTLER
jgi:periplasmic protein TonB